jgi:hypothetical protein
MLSDKSFPCWVNNFLLFLFISLVNSSKLYSLIRLAVPEVKNVNFLLGQAFLVELFFLP